MPGRESHPSGVHDLRLPVRPIDVCLRIPLDGQNLSASTVPSRLFSLSSGRLKRSMLPPFSVG